MVNDCAICCDSLKKPVSIPCGHIFCNKCINNYANSTTTLSVPCPTCREEFEVVSPDLSLLQDKYHKFIIPSIRRVFVTDTKSALEKRVRQLEKQLRAAKVAEQTEKDSTEYDNLAEKHAILETNYSSLQEFLNTCQESLNQTTNEKQDLEKKYQESVQVAEQARAAQTDLWAQNHSLAKVNAHLNSWSVLQAQEIERYKRMVSELKSEVAALQESVQGHGSIVSVDTIGAPLSTYQQEETYYESYASTQFYPSIPQVPALYATFSDNHTGQSNYLEA